MNRIFDWISIDWEGWLTRPWPGWTPRVSDLFPTISVSSEPIVYKR